MPRGGRIQLQKKARALRGTGRGRLTASGVHALEEAEFLTFIADAGARIENAPWRAIGSGLNARGATTTAVARGWSRFQMFVANS